MITVPLVSSRYFEELYKDFYHNTNSFTCLVSSILSQLWEFSTVAFSRVYINYYIPQVKGKGKYKNLDTFVKADIRELWKMNCIDILLHAYYLLENIIQTLCMLLTCMFMVGFK